MKQDLYLSFVILLQMISVVIQLLLPVLGWLTVEQAASFRVYVTILTFLPAAFIVIKRNPYLLIVPFAFYGIFALWNYAFFPESHVFLDSRQAVTLTPVAIMTIVFLMAIRRFDAFMKVLLWVSRLIVPLAFAYVLAKRVSFTQDEGYSMSFGYSLLLPAMYLFRQSGVTDKSGSMILFLLIIADGSRGPVVVMAMYDIIHLFFFTKFGRLWKQLFAVSMVLLITFGGLNDVVGVRSSRTVTLYQQGRLISHQSNREQVRNTIIKKIWERPVTGWGIGSDRAFVNGYAHNLVLELSLHYGVIVAILLMIGFILLSVSCYISHDFLDRHGGRSLLIIILLYGIVPLMVSNSYLIFYNFALMMGYLLRFFHKQVMVEVPFLKIK